jgi:hypothetical protein
VESPSKEELVKAIKVLKHNMHKALMRNHQDYGEVEEQTS